MHSLSYIPKTALPLLLMMAGLASGAPAQSAANFTFDRADRQYAAGETIRIDFAFTDCDVLYHVCGKEELMALVACLSDSLLSFSTIGPCNDVHWSGWAYHKAGSFTFQMTNPGKYSLWLYAKRDGQAVTNEMPYTVKLNSPVFEVR